MLGDYVRDKDAVTASMMVAEMAAHYHKLGMTLLDALKALYEKYGYYKEKTLNLVMPGVDGVEKMKGLMAQLRRNPPEEISGVEVVRMRDYSDGSIYVAGLGKVGTCPVLRFERSLLRAGRRLHLYHPSLRHQSRRSRDLPARKGQRHGAVRGAHSRNASIITQTHSESK